MLANVFKFAACEQSACWYSTPSLGLVVDVMPHPVVKHLHTLFAPLALGRVTGHWQGWGAAGGGCRRWLSLLLLIRQILHRHWSWLPWHIPKGEPLQLCAGHVIKVRQPGKPARSSFAGESTKPFLSALHILADPCSWAAPLLLPA